MTEQRRPGMDADDIRSQRNWFWFITIAAAFMLLLAFVIPGYPRDFAQRASGIWNVVGVIGILGGWFLAFKTKDWATDKTYYLIALGVMFLGLLSTGGWDFSMFKIAERP